MLYLTRSLLERSMRYHPWYGSGLQERNGHTAAIRKGGPVLKGDDGRMVVLRTGRNGAQGRGGRMVATLKGFMDCNATTATRQAFYLASASLKMRRQNSDQGQFNSSQLRSAAILIIASPVNSI